ncbi:hypothetical protein [Streptomyces sp. NPDC047928]|uniref:hypothetical protein n=1 Tax=unclassified Streptomyces TaxID=2593676 RepID=UPI003719F947
MHPDLSPLIAATTRWLTHAYPAGGGAIDRALAEAQARQAVTVAAWLRYPTDLDAALVAVTGAGGSHRLDWITGADGHGTDEDGADGADGHGTAGDRGAGDGNAWRTWVDETVASWAAALLGSPSLAAGAVAAVVPAAAAGGAPVGFPRLVSPGERDLRAAALLRHPDLLAPIADLHRAELLDRLAGCARQARDGT